MMTSEASNLSDAEIDEAAHELQRVIAFCGGEPSEFPYDYLRGILEKLPVRASDSAARAEPPPSNQSEPSEREAFEAWWHQHILHMGQVTAFDVWAAWQARAALSVHQVGAPEPVNSAGETPTEHAHRWATELAVNMAKKFYPEVPQFKPLPDLLGVITQIDNMTTGLVRAPEPAVVEPTAIEECNVCGQQVDPARPPACPVCGPEASPVGIVPKGRQLNEILDASGFKETTVEQRTCLYALLLMAAQDELRRRCAGCGHRL